MPVENGNTVKIEYTGTLEDGTVFDSSEKHGKPLEFKIGEKMVIPGFENAVKGMEKEEEKEVKLEPSDAYGDVNPQLIQEVPKDKLPKEAEPKIGMVLMMVTQTGQQIPARIVEVGESAVKIDLNHPLAGKTLNFKIKIIEYS